MKRAQVPMPAALLLLAALCALAYIPSLSIPLLEDDYPNLWEAQKYGSPAALAVLMGNAVFRLRATSFWLMWLMWKAFRATPWPYHVASLVLHIANTWLAFGIALLWRRLPEDPAQPAAEATAWRGAFLAGAFFAVAEGHQEAVMWFSAVNELLMFLFGGAALLCWMAGWRARRRLWFTASPVLFAFALLSKETAVVFLPLFLLVAPAGWKASLRRLLPHVTLGALAAASIIQSRAVSFRFSDGSFSLHAPFWVILPAGIGRVLWIWGWAAVVALQWRRAPGIRTPAVRAFIWIAVALAPYSFLTYSRQIPSRQTYLASFGLAVLAGLAIAHLWAVKPAGRKIAAVFAALALFSNVGYLWTRKRAQFVARAEPTEQLIRMARRTQGPIWVRCFPRVPYIAEEAVHMGAGRSPSILIWSETEAAARKPAAVFCYQDR